jgi:hypothetical protein
MIRVVFRPSDGGKDFPVYFRGEGIEEQIADASTKLKAVELTRQPSSEFEMMCEQLNALGVR